MLLPHHHPLRLRVQAAGLVRAAQLRGVLPRVRPVRAERVHQDEHVADDDRGHGQVYCHLPPAQGQVLLRYHHHARRYRVHVRVLGRLLTARQLVAKDRPSQGGRQLHVLPDRPRRLCHNGEPAHGLHLPVGHPGLLHPRHHPRLL